ncbi:MAG: hypothetical protein KKH61_20110, partial [Gammaproteobacteria bacterium]|nr:hypothetical protein [Gammaproteobacteria bacterium]
MNVGEIYAKFKLDIGNFKASIGDVTTGLKNVETGAKSSAQPINNLGSSLQSMAMKAAAALGLYKLVGTMTSLIKESTLLASRVETLGIIMTAVGKNVGLNASQMENYAKGVAAMGITTQVSRETVIRMAQAQMDLTNAVNLARIAQDAARVGNTNSSDALQKMIYGIQTGQVEVLKTIGLNVNFESSYKKLATQLGKTSNDLTEREKVLARTNVTMEAGTRITTVYTESQKTLGGQLASMPRYIEEVKLKFGELFTVAYNEIVIGFSASLQKIGIWFRDPENQENVEKLTKQFTLLGKALSNVITFWTDFFFNQEGSEKQNKLSEQYIRNLQQINTLKADESKWFVMDTKRIAFLENINAGILKQIKALGSLRQLERVGSAWQAFSVGGEYPGEQKFDTEAKAVNKKTNDEILKLQESLTADIMKLQDTEWGAFAAKYEKIEKEAGENAKTLSLLNQWAALEAEKIWEKSTDEINKIKAKGEEDFIVANYKALWDQRQAVQESKDAEVKIRQEAIDSQNKSEEEFILANYKRLDDQYKA